MTKTPDPLRVGVYVVHPYTVTVHVMRATPGVTRTMCGVPVNSGWQQGDETISGIAATCGKCRRLMGRPR